MTMTLQHKDLGKIIGVLRDDVAQFLGVKYASMKDRFAKSEMLHCDVVNSVIDATIIG
jgi:carboxylesterase type B